MHCASGCPATTWVHSAASCWTVSDISGALIQESIFGRASMSEATGCGFLPELPKQDQLAFKAWLVNAVGAALPHSLRPPLDPQHSGDAFYTFRRLTLCKPGFTGDITPIWTTGRNIRLPVSTSSADFLPTLGHDATLPQTTGLQCHLIELGRPTTILQAPHGPASLEISD